jgi:hypothetical protein
MASVSNPTFNLVKDLKTNKHTAGLGQRIVQ